MSHQLSCFSAILFVSIFTSACSKNTKQEGADIQYAELSTKRQTFPTPAIKKIRGHNFLCLTSNKINVVIMLDARYSPYYKQLPVRKTYYISSNDFDFVQQSGVANSTALRALESHVKD